MPIVPLAHPEKQLTLGISACLLGEKVRYNGQHKRSTLCTNTLQELFHFQPICPEVAVGLGIPRPPIRLVANRIDKDEITRVKVVGVDDPTLDVTDKIHDYAQQKTQQFDKLSGYILMQKSPSCGMARVKIYHPNGAPLGASGPGEYARVLLENCPLLPIEEEGRLHDPVLADNFFSRVYAYGDWQHTVQLEPSYKGLVDFHSRYKYMLMAHHPKGYVHLGQLVSQGSRVAIQQLADSYFVGFMGALKQHANRKSHTNVIMHMLGYVKKVVSSEDRAQFLKVVEQYRQREVPLSVPMAMLRSFIAVHGSDYIKAQTYLQPYPDVLGMRNLI